MSVIKSHYKKQHTRVWTFFFIVQSIRAYSTYCSFFCLCVSPIFRRAYSSTPAPRPFRYLNKNKARDWGGGRERLRCVSDVQQHEPIKAQFQPRPRLQRVEINWVKKICCLRLKWVMGGSVTIVLCLPEAIYPSFCFSLSSPLLSAQHPPHPLCLLFHPPSCLTSPHLPCPHCSLLLPLFLHSPQSFWFVSISPISLNQTVKFFFKCNFLTVTSLRALCTSYIFFGGLY